MSYDFLKHYQLTSKDLKVKRFFYTTSSRAYNEIFCINCQFICHPNKELRKNRYEMLINSGVLVEDENGNRKAVTPVEAENLIETCPRIEKTFYQLI